MILELERRVLSADWHTVSLIPMVISSYLKRLGLRECELSHGCHHRDKPNA